MIEDILGSLFGAFLKLVTTLVQILFIPIDAFIAAALPELNDMFIKIADLFEIILLGLGWAVSATGVPSAALALLGVYYIFKLTMPLNIWALKLGIKWLHELR